MSYLKTLSQNRKAGNEELMFRLMRAFAILMTVVYLVPYVMIGSNAHWMIWDNLDSSFVTYKVLLESGALFSPNSTIIEQFLGGVPRGTLPSEFSAFVWLYYLLGPEAAYIVNRIIQTIVGFMGMYLLLKQHVLKEGGNKSIPTGVALCYALLPFWPFGGLSVAGMPVALYALLNIRAADYRWYNWLVLFLYPFYSGLVFSGFFLLFSVSIIWVFDIIRKRKWAPLFFALLLISMVYVLTNYRLFLDFVFSPDYVSHRVEFDIGARSESVQGLGLSLLRALGVFMYGYSHAHSLHLPVIFVVAAIASYILLTQSGRMPVVFFSIGLFIVLTSLFFGLSGWLPVYNAQNVIKAFIPMNLTRFYLLHPMLWMVLFAMSLSVIVRQSPGLRWIVLGFVVCQTAVNVSFHEFLKNRNTPSASGFFAVEQFEDVARAIGKPKNSYRVASLGMHPSISLFNGFYTIDGYWPNYPLNYKHKFREVIAGELEKNSLFRRYFDKWGSRVYIFSDELYVLHRDKPKRPYHPYVLNYKNNSFLLKKLALNAEAFNQLGAQYLISAVMVDESQNPYLQFMEKFEHENSAWDIYLYKVNSI